MALSFHLLTAVTFVPVRRAVTLRYRRNGSRWPPVAQFAKCKAMYWRSMPPAAKDARAAGGGVESEAVRCGAATGDGCGAEDGAACDWAVWGLPLWIWG